MENNNLIRGLDNQQSPKGIKTGKFLVFIALAAVAGVLIGFGVTKTKKTSTVSPSNLSNAQPEKTAGIADTKTFKDKAEGVLRAGGIDGEGNFHLERPGGTLQNVYLTSSTVDLSKYIGKNVRVWGQTFSAQKAGWLMDVGLVEILK